MEINSAPKTKLNFALQYGCILAVISIILTLLAYALDMRFSGVFKGLSFVIMIVYLVIVLKTFRDQERGGYISYGGSLGLGTLIGLFYSLLFSLLFMVYFKLLDPDYFNLLRDNQFKIYEDMSLSEEQIEKSMKFIDEKYFFITMVIGGVFGTFIISLIASIFIQRSDPSFDNHFNNA